MTSARAWRVHRHGTPAEALELDVVDVRSPGPGEATVAIEAVGLNFPDLLLCAGRYQESPPLPFVAPRLSGVLPFERAPDALDLLARREAVGRVALGD